MTVAHFYALDTANHSLYLVRFRSRPERDSWVRRDSRRLPLNTPASHAWQKRIQQRVSATFYWRPFFEGTGGIMCTGTMELWHPCPPVQKPNINPEILHDRREDRI